MNGSAAGSAARSALFARGGLAALDALESAGWDVFSGRPKPSRAAAGARGRARPRSMTVEEAYAEVGRITRREAKNFAYGIMLLPREKRQAIAAIYAFARWVDDVADGELPPRRSGLGSKRSVRHSTTIREDAVFVALRDARERFGIPREPLAALIDGGLQDTEQSTYADFDELRGYCEKVAGAVGLACVPVYGSDDTERAMTLGIALQLINIIRDVDEDQRLGRVYLPQDELAAFESRSSPRRSEFRELMAFEAARARTYLAEGLRLLESLDRRSALCVGTFAGLYRETLDRIEAGGFDVFGEKTRLSAPRKLAVVARGCSMKVAGRRRRPRRPRRGTRSRRRRPRTVTVFEARPTLGGAVQTLPEREGDPEPPPDNGQHIALGCFTEYLRFLDRIGEGGSYLRTRLGLPVLDEDGAVARRSSRARRAVAVLASAARDRLRIPLVTARCRNAQAEPGETFGALLRRLGASDPAIDRFWDVFIRPALNLAADEVDAARGPVHREDGSARAARNSDLILPTKPLGWMHGDAAGRALGDRVRLERRVEALDELDADATPVRITTIIGHLPVSPAPSPARARQKLSANPGRRRTASRR